MSHIIQNLIGGEMVDAQSGNSIPSYNPSTGEENARIPDSDAMDVSSAVESAKLAFQAWSESSPKYRSDILMKIADLIESRADELAATEAHDQGKPVSLARCVDIPRAAYNFRFFASAILHDTSPCTKLHDVMAPGRHALNYVDRMPVGVAGLISPWNLPLYLLTWKIAPAIAFGNTCVAKPSEVTSMTAWKLCEILRASPLPPGVVNIVFGLGRKAGEAIVTHPDVPLISFTGSTAVGKHIIRATADHCKKISLELGGKNAAIVFPDADLEKSLPTLVKSAFANQGEVCLCTSRIFVHSRIYDDFIERYVTAVRALKVGAVDDPSTNTGALVSREHYDKVKRYIGIARESGGKIHCGDGVDPLNLPDRCKNGYFVQPTVISGLDDTNPCMTEEIFGPVVCVTSFGDDEAEVIRRANNVQYGLCASVHTQNVECAHRVARKLQVGTVWVNSWLIRDLHMPFGGMKMSGIGRESFDDSRKFFTEAKTVCIPF